MPEARQWAPSRWSPEKIRLHLKHVRNHLLYMYNFADFPTSGIGEAIMSVDVCLSWLAIGHVPNDPHQRAQAVANLTGKPVTVITLKL